MSAAHLQARSLEAPPRYTVHCCARGALLKARATEIKPIDRDRKAVRRAEFKVRLALKTWFRAQRLRLAALLAAELGKLAKAPATLAGDREEEIKRRVARILEDLDFEGYEAFASIAAAEIEALALDAAEQAEKQLAGHVGQISVDAFELANKEAVEWARDRAAEMVGKKWIGGELVDNPNAQYAITDGTRQMLQRFVTDAMEGGYSNDRLAAEIKAAYAFSDDRAEKIARTETARADVEGSIAAYRASGVVERKEWLTAEGCCDECEAIDGDTVPLDGLFDGGVAGPPLHPDCRCDVLPVLTGDGGE